METSKDNSAIDIDQGGHRGKYLLSEELRSPCDMSITSHWHESDCREKTANGMLIISEVMSFVCSDSCENSITREKVLAKGSGNHLFFRLEFRVSRRVLLFPSDALEFTVCPTNAWTNMWNNLKMMEEKAGVFVVSDWTARQYLKVAGPTWKIESSSKLLQVRK